MHFRSPVCYEGKHSISELYAVNLAVGIQLSDTADSVKGLAVAHGSRYHGCCLVPATGELSMHRRGLT